MDGLPFAIGVLVGGGIVWLWARRWLRDRDHWREKAEWLARMCEDCPASMMDAPPCEVEADCVQCWLHVAEEATKEVE